MKTIPACLKIAMIQEWEYLAPDYLNTFESSIGAKNQSASCDREEVIEVVLDANRLETSLQGTFLNDAELSAALKEFRQHSWEEQKELAKQVFTYESYGW